MSRFALVTGAGSGIGRASAQALLREGWTVGLVGRRAEALAETAAGFGVRAVPMMADVSDEAAVAAVFERVRAQFARLDLLFNNAGTSAPPATIDELDSTHWRTVIDVNVHGAFYCAQAAFRLMREQSPQGGRIINNGSIAAHAPRPRSVPYTVSKHAITGLTRALALDGRAFDIACGQIDIGNAATELLAKMPATGPGAEPQMDVAHAASAVLYMASLPLDANVQFMTIMATKMPFIGRG